MKKALIVTMCFLFCVGMPALTQNHRVDQTSVPQMSSPHLGASKMNMSFNQASLPVDLLR